MDMYVSPSEYLFQVNLILHHMCFLLDLFVARESLDTYLVLLVDTSPQTSTSIAYLLSAAIRNQAHRRTIANWLPRSDRMKEAKGKHGWEKPDTTNVNAPGRQGGWVVRNLTIFLRLILYLTFCLAFSSKKRLFWLFLP